MDECQLIRDLKRTQASLYHYKQAIQYYEAADSAISDNGIREEMVEVYRLDGQNKKADELVDKVRYYKVHTEERQRIAQRAHEHVVRGGHTYRDRVKTLVRELKLAGG